MREPRCVVDWCRNGTQGSPRAGSREGQRIEHQLHICPSALRDLRQVPMPRSACRGIACSGVAGAVLRSVPALLRRIPPLLAPAILADAVHGLLPSARRAEPVVMGPREADWQILRSSLRSRLCRIPHFLLRILDSHAGTGRQRRPRLGPLPRCCLRCVLDHGAKDLHRVRVLRHSSGIGGQVFSVEKHMPDPRVLPFFQSARPGARSGPESRSRKRPAFGGHATTMRKSPSLSSGIPDRSTMPAPSTSPRGTSIPSLPSKYRLGTARTCAISVSLCSSTTTRTSGRPSLCHTFMPEAAVRRRAPGGFARSVEAARDRPWRRPQSVLAVHSETRSSLAEARGRVSRFSSSHPFRALDWSTSRNGQPTRPPSISDRSPAARHVGIR